jgi:hypothetical protein
MGSAVPAAVQKRMRPPSPETKPLPPIPCCGVRLVRASVPRIEFRKEQRLRLLVGQPADQVVVVDVIS